MLASSLPDRRSGIMGTLVLFPTVEFAILFALVLPLSWATG